MSFPVSPILPISVIIPSYKPGGYIQECLASLEAQTLNKDKFEVILVLNGCGEPWKSECETLLDSYPQIQSRLIHTMTPGVSNARNIGIDLARGRYIAFIDDDDYVSPRYLESLLESAVKNGYDPGKLILSDSRAFRDGEEGFLDAYPQQEAYIASAPKNEQRLTKVRSILNGPWMKLIPREMIGSIRFDQSLKNGEDSLMIYTLSHRIKRLEYAAPEAIYYRRYRRGSAVTTPKPLSYRLGNALRLSFKMGAAWTRHPFSYNIPFTLTRLLAPFKTVLRHEEV